MFLRWLPGLLILGLAPTNALAHGLDADWKQVGEKIAVEAFFDTGAPVRDARVQIVDDEKNVLASAVTDAEGKCTLRAPNPGQYRLIVDAGAGHRKERPITIAGTLPVSEGAAAPPVTGGPVPARRDEIARFPWERVALGLGVIALFGGAWWWSRRR